VLYLPDFIPPMEVILYNFSRKTVSQTESRENTQILGIKILELMTD
jgi:hypothetical protein